MPLYEFFCEHCGNIISDLVNFNTTKIICPNCGKSAKKIMSESNWSMKCECTNPTPPIKLKKSENKESKVDRRLFRDVMCKKCGNIDERFIYDSELENQICEKCGGCMKVIPSHTSFKLCYNPKKDIVDWQGNRTARFDAVRAERRKGRDVKPLDEN